MRQRRSIWLLVALVVALGTAGCFWKYNTTGRNAGNVGDIYIPFFQDETSASRATDLGGRLTAMVISEFERDKGIRVYQGESERDQAQKELLGTVSRLSDLPKSRNADELEEEYEVVIACSFEYSDIATGDSIWQNSRVVGSASYLLEEGDAGFAAAVEEALKLIVETILDKTVRAW